jgi:hypothetical protein
MSTTPLERQPLPCAPYHTRPTIRALPYAPYHREIAMSIAVGTLDTRPPVLPSLAGFFGPLRRLRLRRRERVRVRRVLRRRALRRW